MVEPTIPELLRVGFQTADELWTEADNFVRPRCPDDCEDKGHYISFLAKLVESPEFPRHIRARAFDTLETIAAHYRTSNEPAAIPPEMYMWSFRVFSGDVERPKRPRGPDGQKNLLRDRVIANSVAWLRHYHGYTYERSIELVAEAAGISPEAVRTVLKNDRDSGRPPPLERVKAVFSRMSIPG